MCLCYCRRWWVTCGQPSSQRGTESGTHCSSTHQEGPSQWGTALPELLSLWLCEMPGTGGLHILESCSGLQGRSTRLERERRNDEELLK